MSQVFDIDTTAHFALSVQRNYFWPQLCCFSVIQYWTIPHEHAETPAISKTWGIGLAIVTMIVWWMKLQLLGFCWSIGYPELVSMLTFRKLIPKFHLPPLPSCSSVDLATHWATKLSHYLFRSDQQLDKEYCLGTIPVRVECVGSRPEELENSIFLGTTWRCRDMKIGEHGRSWRMWKRRVDASMAADGIQPQRGFQNVEHMHSSAQTAICVELSSVGCSGQQSENVQPRFLLKMWVSTLYSDYVKDYEDEIVRHISNVNATDLMMPSVCKQSEVFGIWLHSWWLLEHAHVLAFLEHNAQDETCLETGKHANFTCGQYYGFRNPNMAKACQRCTSQLCQRCLAILI